MLDSGGSIIYLLKSLCESAGLGFIDGGPQRVSSGCPKEKSVPNTLIDGHRCKPRFHVCLGIALRSCFADG
jgi:hypothetical protein